MQHMHQATANNNRTRMSEWCFRASFVMGAAGFVFGMIALLVFVNNDIEKQRSETRMGKTWVAPDDRTLVKESVEEKTLALLTKLAVRYHISKLDDQGACNTAEECLAALEAIEPRFYGTEYMKRELFPRAYQEHLAIGVVTRIREARKVLDQ